MYDGPPDHPPQQWSVRAEFTISHPGLKNPANPPKTDTVQDEKGVKMLYSWSADEHRNQIATSDSSSSNPDKLYGFQKGNLFFTSTPPSKPSLTVPTLDSAYGSDLSSCSPMYHRKCKSTCNIVLSNKSASSCGRTQSLRCQTPSVCCDKKTEGYYGCGDPWCHHVQYTDDYRRISPVRETCEDVCGEECTFCSNPDYKIKRDVSVQTYEVANKCTSPMMKSDSIEADGGKQKGSKLKRGRPVYDRSRQSSVRSSTSPGSVKKDSSRDPLRSSRSPSFKGTPPKIAAKTGSGSEDSSKKPRTIHIDVYCTGTELETDSSSSSDSDSRSKSVSTPQTVFESKNMCVTHKKVDTKKILPYRLSKTNSTSVEKDDSDDNDNASTGYPSKMSSYSTIGRSLSSMTSFQGSCTPFSVSSCTVPDYESSIGNTSWKDTFSDIDSLLHSRSSIPQNDSLYFVPRRIEEETNSTCSSQKMTNTTNSVNLAPSDSFDYADSEDKLRIKRMERMWKFNYNVQSKNKMLKEQDKLQEVVNKRLNKINISKDSDSEASDASEKGWTVLKSNSTPKMFTSDVKMLPPDPTPPSTTISRSPSTVLIKQRLSADPSLRSPFTIVPGKYTEPRYIAKRFGQVITVFKKPGHHVGPAKNPSCSCDHCRRYWENAGFNRNRTCSVGDAPVSAPFLNWKGLKKCSD